MRPLPSTPLARSCSAPSGASGTAPRSRSRDPRAHRPVNLWTSPTDRREPCGPCGQPVDNASALPTACPHSRASRPRTPQDQSPVIERKHHTARLAANTLCLTSPAPATHHAPLTTTPISLPQPPTLPLLRSGSFLDWKTLESPRRRPRAEDPTTHMRRRRSGKPTILCLAASDSWTVDHPAASTTLEDPFRNTNMSDSRCRSVSLRPRRIFATPPTTAPRANMGSTRAGTR